MPGFSSDDRSVIERELDLQHQESEPAPVEDIENVFEVDRCCAWIKDQDVSRVALQFPDYLLHAAPVVAKAIRKRIGQEVFILGDTSYGECCVDEVAAEHLNADSVIHFGHTCLTPPQRLPVIYIYTTKEIDVKSLEDSIRKKYAVSDNILMLYDVEYDHLLKNFSLTDWKGRLCIGSPSDPSEDSSPGWSSKYGRKFKINSWEEVDQFKVLYVSTGGGLVKLMNFMFSFAANEFHVFENNALLPANISINKLLMKRYFLVEKTKDAERIGILVGTLGVSNYADVIQRLRETIRKRGKKCYTFLVGKPNAAKLANFPEIDIFVLVACPETSFPDTSDFFQSVITPYELEIACNSNREWGGDYFTDFRDLLPGGTGFVETGEPGLDEAPELSLVSGRIRGTGIAVGEGGGELTVVNDKTVSVLHKGGGGEFLANRSWSGLEQKLGETDVADVVEGKMGIAAGYSGEPSLSHGDTS